MKKLQTSSYHNNSTGWIIPIKVNHTKYSLLKLSKDELGRLVLDHQGKFNSVLQSLKDDVSKMKSKVNVLESELQVSKNVTDSLAKYIKTLECWGSNIEDCHHLKSNNNVIIKKSDHKK